MDQVHRRSRDHHRMSPLPSEAQVTISRCDLRSPRHGGDPGRRVDGLRPCSGDGRSIAGLLAASVLADHADTVVVIERDELVDAAARTGFPQASQVHTPLGASRVQLDRWFDGFFEDAVADGAVLPGRGCARAPLQRSTQGDHARRRTPVQQSSLPGVPRASRPTRLPNDCFVRGRATGIESAFVGPVLEEGRVTGVRYRNAQGDEHEVRAALTVAADGLHSRLCVAPAGA